MCRAIFVLHKCLNHIAVDHQMMGRENYRCAEYIHKPTESRSERYYIYTPRYGPGATSQSARLYALANGVLHSREGGLLQIMSGLNDYRADCNDPS